MECSLSDFLFYLIYETNLSTNEITEDENQDWDIDNLDAFISTLKNTKVPYSIIDEKVTVVFPKMKIYCDLRGHDFGKQYFLDSMNGII